MLGNLKPIAIGEVTDREGRWGAWVRGKVANSYDIIISDCVNVNSRNYAVVALSMQQLLKWQLQLREIETEAGQYYRQTCASSHTSVHLKQIQKQREEKV